MNSAIPRSVLLVLVLVGCGPTTRPLRGEWVMAQASAIRMTFRDDGTYLAHVESGKTKILQHGEFSQNGTWLNMYTKKVETNDAHLQQAYRKLRLEPQRMQVRWVSDDHVILDSGQGKQSMRRVSK